MNEERAARPEERAPEEGPGLAEDPALERIRRDRKPGEIETGMMSGSDDWDLSATDRFEGELTREEALEVLDPEHTRTGT
ncbi:MAG: hypothetical protein ACK47B_26035 [Armatimonadota bacterium]